MIGIVAAAAGGASLASTAGGGEDIVILWGFILFGVALLLLALELFVPSGGLIGLLCGVAAVGSVVCFFRYSTAAGAAAIAVYVVLAPLLLVLIFRVWVHSPLARRMILGGADDADTAGDDGSSAPQRAQVARLAQMQQLVGAEGMTITALRPVGTVRINGQRLDALAESGIIEAGVPIVVADVYDNQIKVRPK
jgi:membrane-bound ClpP family serine protease